MSVEEVKLVCFAENEDG